MRVNADYSRYDDESLIRAVTELQAEALEQLYERYSALLFGLALMIVGDRSIAEEIILDVFMRVWQRAGSYRPERAKVSTWLTHITRNYAIDVLRRQIVRPDRTALSLEEITTDGRFQEQDPQEQVETTLRHERIRSAVSRLPSEQRQALLLAYFGGYTQSQIAEILELPLGTVKTRIRLGMQKLHGLLRDENDPEDKSGLSIRTYSTTEEK
jgi:RNA polymerase sigma-70 factor, ECF subfamily